MFLKQHRKAELQLEGRKLIGKFNVSLTNLGDRDVMNEFISEVRKQLRDFDPNKKKKTGAKRRTKKKTRRKVVKRRR